MNRTSSFEMTPTSFSRTSTNNANEGKKKEEEVQTNSFSPVFIFKVVFAFALLGFAFFLVYRFTRRSSNTIQGGKESV